MPVRIPPLHSTLLRRGPSGRTRPATAEAPAELVTLATTTLAYVTNYEDGTVSVIDTATNTVTTTIAVDFYPNDVAVAVVPVASTVTVTATPNPAQVHQPVTLTAHVTCTGHTPTGTVRFYDGTTLLGTRTLNAAGTTTLTISNLNAGTHQITAVYSGDTDCEAATSPPLPVRVISLF
jgi:YVTN family beta-propeller protein